MTDYLLAEDGTYILQENGDKIILEDTFPTILASPTSAWNVAIKANQRDFKCLIKIYFDGENGYPYGFNETDIESIDLLEETFAEGETPLGAVSSNELVLSLYNRNNNFSPKNTDSPYYGKLVPNIKIELSIGIKLADLTYEYLDLGTFYTSNWSMPTNSLMVNIICHDRLFNIFNSPMPQIPIQESINMSTMFVMLFYALSLTSSDYNIDAISHGISIAALPQSSGDTIRDGMQIMAERSLCNVFIPREGVIRVIRNNNVLPYDTTWTDSDMIINADQPIDYSNIYSQVEVGYHVPFVGEQESVLIIEKVEVPDGGITLDNLFFDSVVGAVENVKLIGAVNSYISSMTIGARSISITLANASASETVAIEIDGRPVKTVDATYLISDATAQALVGNIKFSFDSEYIQSKNDAIIFAGKLLALVTDPSAYITVDSRGDLAVELTDSLMINDVIDSIENLEVVPIRMHYDFTNGLECDMVAIKKSVRELT